MLQHNGQSDLIDFRDILELLREHPLPSPFKLTLYSEDGGAQVLWDAIRSVCQAPDHLSSACNQDCFETWQETVSQSLLRNEPVVGCCSRGFLGFAVPFPELEGFPDCLMGGGLPQCPQRQLMSAEPDDDQVQLLLDSDGHQAYQTSREQALSVAEEIFRFLPRLLDNKLHTMSLARMTRRLDAVREVSRDLAKCASTQKALAIASEALVVLFDLPKVLVLLKQSRGITLHSTLGLDRDACQVDSVRLLEHLGKSGGIPQAMGPEEASVLFPDLKPRSAYLVPLSENDHQSGVMVLLDVDLHARDLALIELLVSRLATRIERLRIDEGLDRERHFSSRLVSMISALSLIDSREKLFQEILSMSSDLLEANSGSLMLLNEIEGTLTIVAAKGMSASLARSMSVPYGEGIAGRVAKNGYPMLVNDIERDNRTSVRNRPRFKTKSFISLPLKARDRLVGVLNLADKANGSNFSEADLNLVQTFTGHAIQMIDRATTLEQAEKYEKLSVTDPLTGLNNRRYLEKRLLEEISRGQRLNQQFCVVLTDLDNFKLYNDVCGHLAGDKALSKAALLMRRTARDVDVVTRYGGEEFCLVLPGTGKKESMFVADRIRRIIETENFPGETHLPLGRLTISLGVACFPEDGHSTTELIHAADLALYRAKDLGRNRIILYDPSLDNATVPQHHQQEQD